MNRFFINKDNGKVPVSLKEFELRAGYDEKTIPQKGDVIIVEKTQHAKTVLLTMAIIRHDIPLIFAAVPKSETAHQCHETLSYKPESWPVTDQEFSKMLKIVFPKTQITLQPTPQPISSEAEFTVTEVR